MNAGWGLWPRISWNPPDFTMKSGRFHPDCTCEIHPNYKSKCFIKNSSVWWMQGRGYDQGFHEIHQISPWNLADLTCEIQWISPRYHLWNPPKIIKASVSAKTLQFDECRVGDFTLEIQWISPWNLADFTQISPVKSTQNYKSKCFSKNSSVWWMQGGGFDPRNLVDFTLKSGGFHPWNLVDFTQIAPVKSTQNYKRKCFSKNFSLMNAGWGLWPRISWNPHEIRRIWKLLAFAWWSSIGLSFFERPNIEYLK